MQLKTGAHPENISVEIKEIENDEVVYALTFDQANHVYTEDIELLNGGCYRMSVRDSHGEGMGNGYFQFKDASNRVIMKGGGSYGPFTYEMSSEVSCDGTLSVDEPTATIFKVYPNPSSGLFYVDLGEGQWQVQVYDLMGRKVFENQCDGKASIDLGSCQKGLYFLKAVREGEEVSLKLMLK